jgi:kynurenine formamidase
MSVGNWSGDFQLLSTELPPLGPARIYDLAVRLEGGMSHHPAHPPFSFSLTGKHGDVSSPDGDSVISDVFSMGTHIGTHVDALGHFSYCGRIHGGIGMAGRHSLVDGLEVGSVEEVPPLIGNGHLIDAELLLGRRLTPADKLGAAELDAWFEGHLAPEANSIVLIRTGWMRYWGEMKRYVGLETGLPGLDLSGARWLSERKVMAVGGDTMALEWWPPHGAAYEVHRHLLVEEGIYIMESLQLERAAADHVRDFTFFAVPLRLKGATGSPLRPLALIPDTA